MDTVSVCAAQLAPVFSDREASLAKAIDAIHEGARGGAQLVSFPESYLPGYPYWAVALDPLSNNAHMMRLMDQAVSVDSPAVHALCRAARSAAVIVSMGVTERSGGTLYNTQLLVGADGELLSRRRKLVPTSHERMVWGRGDGSGLVTCDTSIGTLGGLICYEHLNPLFRYAIQCQREQIHLAVWPGGMVPRARIQAVMTSYALESQTFVISTSSVLTQDTAETIGAEPMARLGTGGGSTCIIDPKGRVVAEAAADEETLLFAELDLSVIDAAKTIVDCSGHYSRPDVAHLVIDSRPQSPLQAR